MHLKPVLHVIITLFVSISSLATLAATFQVKPFPFEGSMPFVESSDKALAEKINEHIYSDILDMAAPKSLQDKITWTSEISYPPQSEISYEVLRNDGNILSIQVNFEGCGAYCESNTYFYNFDPQNGNPIEATELFTPKGMQTLDTKLTQLRIAKMKKEIVRLKKEAKKHLANNQAQEDDGIPEEDSIVLYESCMEAFERRGGDNISFDKIKITKTLITFIGSRCSNHAMRAADTLYDFENEFPIGAMKPYLSDYGKSILAKKALKL